MTSCFRVAWKCISAMFGTVLCSHSPWRDTQNAC